MTLSVAQMQTLHQLPDLPQVLSDYIYTASNSTPIHAWDIQGNIVV